MADADLTHSERWRCHADLMVNFATTVTLEAAIVDTPTLLVAFSPIDPDEMQRYVIGLHFQMHYKVAGRARPGARGLGPRWVGGWINRYLDDRACIARNERRSFAEWSSSPTAPQRRRPATRS